MRRREPEERLRSRTGNHPELAKIIEAAQQIDPRDARGFAAFRAVAMAVAEARMVDRPKRIDTAPRLSGRALLLYCPEQAGWHSGTWCAGRWVSTADVELELEPTHWTDVPGSPEET
jgi:hypothetical protein